MSSNANAPSRLPKAAASSAVRFGFSDSSFNGAMHENAGPQTRRAPNRVLICTPFDAAFEDQAQKTESENEDVVDGCVTEEAVVGSGRDVSEP
jgi:hypothetical protein